jgi:hypothetical protein|tara:strand:+ start:150 stop:611 length:462 start_codon:yes stop_codon:yes gene_type:complete
MVQKLKKQGILDPEISKRMQKIKGHTIDSQIASGHPDPYIREIAGDPDLTLEEKERIYGLTQEVQNPSISEFDDSPFYRNSLVACLFSDNPDHSQDYMAEHLCFPFDHPDYNERADCSCSFGMHIVSPQHEKMRKVSDAWHYPSLVSKKIPVN